MPPGQPGGGDGDGGLGVGGDGGDGDGGRPAAANLSKSWRKDAPL